MSGIVAEALRIEEGRRKKKNTKGETKMIALLVVLTFLAAVTLDHFTLQARNA